MTVDRRSRPDTTRPAGPVSTYTEWDPLEEVIVGTMRGAAVPQWDVAVESCVPASARELFTRSAGQPWPRAHAEAAEAELDAFAGFLTSRGIVVTRPDPVDHTRSFSTPRWSSPGGLYSAMPRDLLLVVGDMIIESPMAWRSRYFEADAYHRLLTDYFRRGARWIAAPRPLLDDDTFDAGFDRETPFATGSYATTEVEPTFDAADFTRCGTDLFAQRSHVTNRLGIEWVARHLDPEYTVHIVETIDPYPMHIDASFVPLAPGKLLLNRNKVKDVPSVLDAWDVRVAPEPAVPDDFELYMSSPTVGMNVLMLSETQVVVEAQETALADMLDGWGFDILPIPFRNVMRFGGCFHCVTADVRRRGELRSVV
ncbi:amidinotransferase [Amycolatopsis panacis]|uniref:Amidinotransferase n=2 Tax=Amycolatopsis panacis TaxID=2340917 RepID=A0A419HUW2_9PSEU|nr:amidinotransferase [Amycolatopsis panacis]